MRSHSFFPRIGIRACKLLVIFLAGLCLWACSGADDNATPAAPDNPAPVVKANTVSASVVEGDDIVAYVGNSAAITVAFSTADGVATALKLDAPAAPGWQSADGKLACDTVSATQPCRLRLRYAPDAPAASAPLTLTYTYTDSTGSARSSKVTVNYRALPANAATVTLNSAGTVKVIVGSAKIVTVSFSTNDGSAAGHLHADLTAALPAGWSTSTPVFDCASFGVGNACQLQLLYQPLASTEAASFDIPYAYVDSAGKAQSGKLTIAYVAPMPNAVYANVSPGVRIAVMPGASREVTFTFVPADDRSASAVKLADGARLPEGWSVKSSTLPCATAGPEGECQLVLNYAPTTSVPPQRLELGFDYVNANGQPQQGVARISYSSPAYAAYVADFGSSQNGGGPLQCEVTADGSLINCAKVASAWPAIGTSRIAINGGRAYVTTSAPSESNPRTISVCDVNIDGSLVNCTEAGARFDGIISFAALGQDVYLVSPIERINRITRCMMDDRGGVPEDGCRQLPFDITGLVVPSALTAFKSALYVASAIDRSDTGARLLRCVNDPNNVIRNLCQTFPAVYPQLVQSMAGASLSGGDYLYLLSSNLKTGALVKCTLAEDGSVSACDGGTVPPNLVASDLGPVSDIAISGKTAYLAVVQGNMKGILRCAINETNGDVGDCVAAGDTGATLPVGIALR